MNIENFLIPTSKNMNLSARFYYNQKDTPRAVIFSHGLFSTKDGNKITNLSDHIVNENYSLLTFDFRFSGESGGNISEISIMDEVEDLKNVISHLKSNGIREIHLMGSSLGGVISILAASSGCAEIKSLILIATPIELVDLPGDITPDEIETLETTGYHCYKGVMINNRFLKELKDINMTEKLQEIICPVMAIHGSNDNVVAISDYYLIEKNVKSHFTGKIIENGDHRLYNDRDFQILTGEIISWLRKHND